MGLSEIDICRLRQDLRDVDHEIEHGLLRLRHHRPGTLRRVRTVGKRFTGLKIGRSGACVFVRKRRVVSDMIVELLMPIYGILHHRHRARVGRLTRRGVRFRGRLADCRHQRLKMSVMLHGRADCGLSPLCGGLRTSVRHFLGRV